MRRKKDRFSQAVVGLFMVTVLLLLGYFTIVISGVDVITGHNRVPVRIAFDSVGGLKDRDNVMYRGTKVGAVERVEVTPSNLVVVAEVDANVVLRKGAVATVCHLSMLGGNYLALDEGEGEIVDIRTTLFRGETPTDWMKDVSKIASNLRAFTSRPELHSIVTNLNETIARSKAFVAKMNDIADKVSAVVARVESGEGTAGKLLSSDDSVYNDLKATVAEAKNGAAAFRKAAESFDGAELMAGGKEIVAKGRDIAAKGDMAMDKANLLLDTLNAAMADIKSGKGTFGKLANDDRLYDEMNGLIRDVRQVIDNYRDTTPISTFSSLAAGAL